jgi:hypothetical protein
MLEPDDSRKIRITKIEAAKRQLHCAIETWFLQADEISTHTLTFAAFTIIEDICKCRGIARESLYNPDFVKDEYHRDWQKLLKVGPNFFKHANKDSEGDIEFAPVATTMFLMSAVQGLGYLGVLSGFHERALSIWLALHRPMWVKEQFRQLIEGSSSAQQLEALRGLSKPDFFHCLKQEAVWQH